MTTEVESLAQWLDREAKSYGPTGYMTEAGFAHFLLKLATALRDIEYETERAASGIETGTAKSEALSAKHESPTPKADAQKDSRRSR